MAEQVQPGKLAGPESVEGNVFVQKLLSPLYEESAAGHNANVVYLRNMTTSLVKAEAVGMWRLDEPTKFLIPVYELITNPVLLRNTRRDWFKTAYTRLKIPQPDRDPHLHALAEIGTALNGIPWLNYLYEQLRKINLNGDFRPGESARSLISWLKTNSPDIGSAHPMFGIREAVPSGFPVRGDIVHATTDQTQGKFEGPSTGAKILDDLEREKRQKR